MYHPDSYKQESKVIGHVGKQTRHLVAIYQTPGQKHNERKQRENINQIDGQTYFPEGIHKSLKQLFPASNSTI
jgi:hypothetical protein